MNRLSYRQINVTQILAQDWDGGASTNDVRISVYDITDDAIDIDSVAMTSETGSLFSYSWTPTEAHTYRIDYFNSTLDSHDTEIAKVITEVTLGG